jgi:hypothetical protein
MPANARGKAATNALQNNASPADGIIAGISFFDWTNPAPHLIIRLFELAPRLSLLFLHDAIPKVTWTSHLPSAARETKPFPN